MTVRQTTRVPKHLHTWLADRAKANHRSLNAELISILSIEAAKSGGTTVSLNSVFIGGDMAAIEQRTADMISGTRGNER